MMFRRLSHVQYNSVLTSENVEPAKTGDICYKVDDLYCMASNIHDEVWNINVHKFNKRGVGNIKSALRFCAFLGNTYNIRYIHVSKKWDFFRRLFPEFIIYETENGVIYILNDASIDRLLNI